MVCDDMFITLKVNDFIRNSNKFNPYDILSKKKEKVAKMQPFWFLLAALHGFEPRLTESESAVLPLDDSAINALWKFV